MVGWKYSCSSSGFARVIVMYSVIALVKLSRQSFQNCSRMHSNTNAKTSSRAVFKWLSKVITRLQLLLLVTGLKDSRQFFNRWKVKPKPIAPRTRDFSRALSEWQIIARNCDWFAVLFVPVVIGPKNCFGFGFSTLSHLKIALFNTSFEDKWHGKKHALHVTRKTSNSRAVPKSFLPLPSRYKSP